MLCEGMQAYVRLCWAMYGYVRLYTAMWGYVGGTRAGSVNDNTKEGLGFWRRVLPHYVSTIL